MPGQTQRYVRPTLLLLRRTCLNSYAFINVFETITIEYLIPTCFSLVVGQNANRTKCQPDIMPTKGWHFVWTYFCGWHFVHPNFLVGILSEPSQHVLVFCPIGPARCEISFSILFIQYLTHLGQLGPSMGIHGKI